jgi:hypothetical protein
MSPSEFYPGVSYGLMYCREIEQAGGQYTAIFSVHYARVKRSCLLS